MSNHLNLDDPRYGAATAGAARQLYRLRADRERVAVTIARRELRKWLRDSHEGRAVETAVAKLLA